MHNYVIMKGVDNNILSIDRYYEKKFSIEKIKESILNWSAKNSVLELVTDKTIIEILDYYHSPRDQLDLKEELQLFETAIEEIQYIINKLPE